MIGNFISLRTRPDAVVRAPLVWLFLLLLLASPIVSHAHVGEINVFFEGQAGPYPVRVVVRPPGVIPGLAEISVRVETNGVAGVTALPVRWDTGRQGAPPPDEAQLVRGETNLYSAQLWFMRGGAQSVEVEVRGAAGVGKVIVPINAIATRVLGMPKFLGVLLAGLGLLLVALAISIVGAAVRESILPPGVTPSRRRRWFAAATVVVAFVGVTALLWLGQRWWEAEAGDYRNNRLYRPVEAKIRLHEENGRRVLNLERPSDPSKRNGPLVPEHGKLMHLFLVRAPGMDAFAHLHPVRVDWKTFEATLPDLPSGEYRVYADVTYETGLSDTLTAQVQLPEPGTSGVKLTRDNDDGWRLSEAFNPQGGGLKQRVAIASNLWMELSTDGPLVENRDLRWRAQVSDVMFRPIQVEHYMGMGGHLILRREDGTVFTHLHPSGSFSMAAQQLFELRADGKAPLRVASAQDDPICKLPALDAGVNALRHDQLFFPYAFPKAGAYRLWVQVKVRGDVLTGVFDVKVAPARSDHYTREDSRP